MNFFPVNRQYTGIGMRYRGLLILFDDDAKCSVSMIIIRKQAHVPI